MVNISRNFLLYIFHSELCFFVIIYINFPKIPVNI